MTEVFISPEIQATIDLFPFLDNEDFRGLSVGGRLARLAEALQAGEKRAIYMLRWNWPGSKGLDNEALMAANLTMDDARQTIAREHGFVDWSDMLGREDERIDRDFEAALDAILAGDLAGLAAQLDQRPELINQRTAYGHNAGLIHYLGNNGVEAYRQVVPMNAVAVAELLLERGADLASTCDLYGSKQTAFDLASTSVHPGRAGITEKLNEVLRP